MNNRRLRRPVCARARPVRPMRAARRPRRRLTGEGGEAMTELAPLDSSVLPPGVCSRFVDGVNGLRMHVLEAGESGGGRPLLLLLHGFPELAYSWHKVMPALAAAGFHVVAPDQRGYGRTTGGDDRYDGDVGSFRVLNLVEDAVSLLSRLQVRDIFRSV